MAEDVFVEVEGPWPEELRYFQAAGTELSFVKQVQTMDDGSRCFSMGFRVAHAAGDATTQFTLHIHYGGQEVLVVPYVRVQDIALALTEVDEEIDPYHLLHPSLTTVYDH